MRSRGVVRNPDGMRRWMSAYAAATATTAPFETIRDAATAGYGNNAVRLPRSGRANRTAVARAGRPTRIDGRSVPGHNRGRVTRG